MQARMWEGDGVKESPRYTWDDLRIYVVRKGQAHTPRHTMRPVCDFLSLLPLRVDLMWDLIFRVLPLQVLRCKIHSWG